MRCVLIGAGNIGQRHARALRALAPEAEIVALRSGRGGALPPGVADREIYDPREALALRPDCAIVADPAPHHPSSAIPMIAAGIPVLIEKPIAVDAAGAEALSAAARDPNKILVGYVLRHDEALGKFRDWLRGGIVGNIVSVHLEAGQSLAQWRTGSDLARSISARPETGGGVLFELSHELDSARWLLGEIESLQALADRRGRPALAVEDTALLLLRCEQGPALVQIDMTRGTALRRYRAVGTLGTLAWTAADGTVRFELPDETRILHSKAPERDARLHRQMAHFLAVVRGGAKPLCTLDDGVRALTAALQARRDAGLDAGRGA